MSSQWETFCDVGYYHMWRLRRKTERGWNDGFHINTRDEAQSLCKLLNKLDRELDEARQETTRVRQFMDHGFKVAAEEATELRKQRDRLAEALRSIAKGSHCMQCYGGDGVWIAQQALAAVKGGSHE